MTVKYHIHSMAFAIIALLLTALCAGCGQDSEDPRRLFEDGLREMTDGDPSVAYRLLHRAVTLFDERGDSVGAFEAKANLSLLCDMIGQKKEAYDLLKSTRYYHVKKRHNYSSQYYLRMRAYYASTIDFDYTTASRYLDSLMVVDSVDFPANKAYLYMDKANKAEMYFMMGRKKEAWSIIRDLESKPLADEIYLSQTYYTHALLLLDEGSVDSARVYAERSIGYSKKYNALDNEANAIKIIMRTDSVHGNMGEYIRHRDKYDSLFKEIRGNEMARHVAVIKEQHKFDLLKKDALRRHYVSMLWLGVLSAGLIVLAVVIYLLYKQTLTRQKMAEMERQRLDAEVEHKRMENELLQLKMQQADEELTRAYQNNIAMSRRLAAKDNQPQELTRLEQMEQTMQQTQAPFLAHVQKLYPHLTHNDMLIMGFIRMGMTMQEIAAAMGVSVDSISKARYRLRKKLDMDSVEALNNFIASVEA